MTRPLIDAHLDLSWCALSFDRDLTLPLSEIRHRESGMTDNLSRGRSTVCFEAMRRGGVMVCIGTMLVRAFPTANIGRRLSNGGTTSTPMTQLPRSGPLRIDLDFGNTDIAHAVAHGQLAWYRLMEANGHLRLIRTRQDLADHANRWKSAPQDTPAGLVLSMEGADPITKPEQVEHWWHHGLRLLGPVHYGFNAYGVGTGYDGPLTAAGHELLRACESVGMIIDVTHLCDTSFYQTLEAFSGRVIASHHNCRALVPGDRQLSDTQIQMLIARDAVIGSALDAWMLYPGWKIGHTPPSVVGLDAVADHIDHICQLAGNTRHAAIGSDLDGGFGTEQCPRDLNSIADVQNIAGILASRGYTDEDIDAIFYGNWMRLLTESLPE